MPPLDEVPIIDLGKTPIPGDQPCGVDSADGEQYITVGAEMSKLGRIEAGEPDWFVIEQNASNVLRSKSKDVEIAAWLGHALFKRYSYKGLAATLALLTELTKNFWDGCYPSRPRRRKARIEELVGRFVDQKWFEENPPKADDFDALDVCVARAEELKNALTTKMPDEPADFSKFVRGVKAHAEKRPKPAAAGAPPAEGQPAAARPAGAGFAAGEIADAGSALNAILAASTFLRKADPTDPIPYAIARILKWSRLSLPTTPAGKVEITPPEAALVDALTHQFNNGVWEHLLKNAEGAFRSSDPLWLDLQRYVCAAMKGLGPTFEKAREAVLTQTAGLLGRLRDGLFELRFRNGTPLCSGETRMWLETEAAPKGGSAAAATDSGDGALSDALAKARKLAGSGDLKGALKELRDGSVMCTQQRDRLIWRLRTAQLCYDAQRLQIAAPLLEECYEEIKRHGVDEWEPRLAVDVAQVLYRCRKALAASEKTPAPESLQGVRDAFAWLCQLDPLAALAVEPSDK